MDNNYAIKKIQETFDVNSIYAHRVFSMTKTKDFLSEASEIISEKPKPFVKWVGGKRQLLKQFRQMNLYPPERFNPKKGKYFEPFVGGGAVFFDLLPKRALLSDLNPELINTYKIIKSNIDELINSLKKHKYEKEYFLKVRAKNPNQLSNIESASRFIFLNRTCFNGIYRVNSKGQFNVPFGRYSNPLICDEKNLRLVSKALKNIDIKFQDYKKILSLVKKDDFIYFDPPYHPLSKTSSFTSYTLETFLEKEQIELRDIFLKLSQRGCFVMLSNSNTLFINKIYSEIKKEGIKISIVNAGRSTNSNALKRGKITEVLITNY